MYLSILSLSLTTGISIAIIKLSLRNNAQIMRWVLCNDKVDIVIVFPVVSDRDKMLKYSLAHSLCQIKQKCTNVFIM